MQLPPVGVFLALPRSGFSSPPVLHDDPTRSLAEILDPQPEASVVIKRLLDLRLKISLGTRWLVVFCCVSMRCLLFPQDWIDWADQNSQAGLAKPPFETEQGEPIFPEEEEAWWLTDISRRAAPEEKVEGDEDGPPSDLEEQKQGEVTDSDASEPGESGALPISRPHVPVVAWRR